MDRRISLSQKIAEKYRYKEKRISEVKDKKIDKKKMKPL